MKNQGTIVRLKSKGKLLHSFCLSEERIKKEDLDYKELATKVARALSDKVQDILDSSGAGYVVKSEFERKSIFWSGIPGYRQFYREDHTEIEAVGNIIIWSYSGWTDKKNLCNMGFIVWIPNGDSTTAIWKREFFSATWSIKLTFKETKAATCVNLSIEKPLAEVRLRAGNYYRPTLKYHRSKGLAPKFTLSHHDDRGIPMTTTWEATVEKPSEAKAMTIFDFLDFTINMDTVYNKMHKIASHVDGLMQKREMEYDRYINRSRGTR